eukprot:GHVR01070993.1.p1 GENE.GHVR01070993.1~~GHVR01070993.1.p1  ORF type:complete len:249 (+),score=37.36 GHVR01070993.1:26-772(+)
MAGSSTYFLFAVATCLVVSILPYLAGAEDNVKQFNIRIEDDKTGKAENEVIEINIDKKYEIIKTENTTTLRDYITNWVAAISEGTDDCLVTKMKAKDENENEQTVAKLENDLEDVERKNLSAKKTAQENQEQKAEAEVEPDAPEMGQSIVDFCTGRKMAISIDKDNAEDVKKLVKPGSETNVRVKRWYGYYYCHYYWYWQRICFPVSWRCCGYGGWWWGRRCTRHCPYYSHCYWQRRLGWHCHFYGKK